jgi:hypothetical protein
LWFYALIWVLAVIKFQCLFDGFAAIVRMQVSQEVEYIAKVIHRLLSFGIQLFYSKWIAADDMIPFTRLAMNIGSIVIANCLAALSAGRHS